MSKIFNECVDLSEIVYCRYIEYNNDYNENVFYFILRGGKPADITFYGDRADFMFEQYTKYKKRKSIVSHTIIYKEEDK